ncbi:MAG: transporter substrate-binding domain-containing protein [Gammaproteobacteria bacterium]|nr:transporter substrate-binding domain-containing protein [Gammaproteobacteria bacterium]
MKRFIVACLLLAAVPSLAETELSVVVSELAPCAMQRDGEWMGFSVELWDTIAEELDWNYDIAAQDIPTMLSQVESKAVDVGIGCISVNYEREQSLDFTHPILDGGVKALSRKSMGVLPQLSRESQIMLVLLLSVVLVFAHLMWFSERGRETIDDRYFPGIFEACWFSIVTMSTVGYGDVAPRRWLGRISAMLIILLGVTTFGIIFGQFAADAISPPAANPVSSYSDLHKYRIGAKVGTYAYDYLTNSDLEVVDYETMEAAIEDLRNREIDLVIHDYVAVSYAARKNGDLVETNAMFYPHHLGFALAQGSQLVESINRTLLQLREDGRYQAIHDKWIK